VAENSRNFCQWYNHIPRKKDRIVFDGAVACVDQPELLKEAGIV